MSTYVITTGVNNTFTVPSGQIDTSQTSLKLVGRGAAGYGFAFAENTIKQLSNFASPDKPLNPIIGQLWYDSSTQSLFICTNKSGTGTWVNIATENSQASAFVTKSELFGSGDALTVANGGTGLTATGAAGQMLISDGAGGMVWSSQSAALTTVLRTDTSTAPVTTDTIELGSASLKFKTIFSTTFDGTAVSAQYADVAERYAIDQPSEPGDLVELGGKYEIRKTSSAFSNDVVGVISTNPAIMMNSSAGDDITHPFVALVGRTPVKVVGIVKKHQRLVSSPIAGVAMAAPTDDYTVFQVIGRALADHNSTDVGVIEVMLGAK